MGVDLAPTALPRPLAEHAVVQAMADACDVLASGGHLVQGSSVPRGARWQNRRHASEADNIDRRCSRHWGLMVDRDQLKARQRPLKERYRADSAAALVMLHAVGALDDQEVSCSVQTGRALVEAGLHPASGGSGSLACSGDMLLQALVACAGVTLRSVATSRGLDVTGTVRAEGDLDFRGTLGIDPQVPVGFTAIRLYFDLDTDAPADDVAALLAATERYCVVFQTLAARPSLAVTMTRSAAQGD
jgi:uncharacterized OsmC-like protein